MRFRSVLRDLVAGVLLAASLGGMSTGYAQSWLRDSAASVLHVQANGRGADRRAEQERVRSQIERMEARARADDRLNGREERGRFAPEQRDHRNDNWGERERPNRSQRWEQQSREG
jgi:hypothetical protein